MLLKDEKKSNRLNMFEPLRIQNPVACLTQAWRHRLQFAVCDTVCDNEAFCRLLLSVLAMLLVDYLS